MQYYLVIVLLLSVSLSQDCQGCDSCIIFYGGNNCSSCQANYYLNSSSNQCIACPQNQFSSAGSTSVTDCIYSCSLLSGCSNCINSTSCSFCSQNYYMIVNGICNSCPAGQYTPPNNTLSNCTACANLCYYCSSTSNDCLSCPADYYLDSTNSTCLACPIGYYQLVQNTATSCLNCYLLGSAQCLTCTGVPNQKNCTSCLAYYYLVVVNQLSNGALIFQCSPCAYIGQYSLNFNNLTSCLQCPSPYCQGCNSTACLGCQTGYYLNGPYCIPCVFPCYSCTNASVCLYCTYPSASNGTSCVTCPQSTILLTNGTCQSCPTGCFSCNQYNNNCYVCLENYQLSLYQYECQPCQSGANCPPPCHSGCQTCSQNGSCLTCYPTSFLYSYFCVSCQQYCFSCLSPTNCTGCVSGYFLYENFCFICPGLQISFPNNTQSFCCSPNCSSCLNNMTCLTCTSDYYMIQGSLCIACPFGQTNPAGNNNTNCSLYCPNGCSSCIFFQNICLTCFEGYSYNAGTGTCFISSSNSTENDSGLPKSTIIVLSTVIPVCVLVIIGIIVYSVIKNKKQSNIGATVKPRTSDVEIGDRKYFKLTETNLAVQ